MRVGQLARKLAISPSDIVDFLGQREIYMEEGSNAKLSDELLSVVVQHFAPDSLSSFLGEGVKEEEIAPKVPESLMVEPNENIADLVAGNEEPAEIIIPASDNVSSEVEDNPSETIEVIKAPKMELPGLRVIGKIDLPEPKKKDSEIVEEKLPEEITESDEIGTEKRKHDKRGVRHEHFKKSRRDKKDHSKKNSVVVQREREAREAEKKRKREEKIEKERRAHHYLKKVSSYSPVKPTRLYRDDEEIESEKKVVAPASHQPKKARPKSVWGKFVKWLRRD